MLALRGEYYDLQFMDEETENQKSWNKLTNITQLV